jgi:hypothetical protein
LAEPITCRVFRALALRFVRLFHGRVEVIGIERVPDRRPLILAASPQQGLMGGLRLAAALLDRDLRGHLLDRRRLMAEFRELVHRVSEPVLSGAAS